MTKLPDQQNKKKSKFKSWLQIPVETEEYQPPRLGVILLQCLVALLFFVFVVRFWYLQVHKGEGYAELALQNRMREERIIAPRGLITDHDGIVLADNVLAYGLSVIREDCPDISATLAQVSQWTGIAYEELYERYTTNRRKTQSFEPTPLVNNLDISLVARIEAELLHWPGLEISTGATRTYPRGEIYGHILGYVSEVSERDMDKDASLNMGDLVGKQGLELVLEQELRGKKGLYQLEVDVLGRSLNRTMVKDPMAGSSVQLSLDTDIQVAAWTALGGEAGSIVVMEPDTGKLVALVTAPAYDNNLFTSGISHKDWNILRNNPRFPLQNRVIQSMYPPASVWKLMMTGLFLHEGINPSQRVHCSGEVKVGNLTFRCWKKHGHGSLNMMEALKQSCDVYFYHFAERIGIDKIEAYAKASGFGNPTGIMLPHENGGIVPSRAWKRKNRNEPWVRGDTINVSIGQGFTLVTPLQVATYVSALLNGGKLMEPQVLRSIEPKVLGTLPAKPEHLEFIVDAMRKTAFDGTAKVIGRQDADMGGKTGTAQVVKIKMRGEDRIKNEELEYKQRDHAWIATWGAKDAKRYVVIVMIEHGGGGSAVAGPVAKKIYDSLFGLEEVMRAEVEQDVSP